MLALPVVRRRYNWWHISLISMVAFLWLHFLSGCIVGRNGILEGAKIRRNIVSMKVVSAQLQEQRGYLEQRIAKLYSGSIDKDLLEEQARILLGYSSTKEDTVTGHCYTE